MRLLVGLGNPGSEYESTRHNAGFWFVQRLADKTGVRLRSGSRFQGLVGRIVSAEGSECWLLMPQTYMNASGRSVAAIARWRLTPIQRRGSALVSSSSCLRAGDTPR